MSFDLIRAILALIFVLGLMGLMAYGLRRYGWKIGLPTPMNTTGKARRLQLLEVLSLDTRNKLVLVRHDDHEHLLAINPEKIELIKHDKKLPSSNQ